MNNAIPGYLSPFVLIGSVAAMAAVLYGIDRALRLAGLPVRDRRYTVWSGSALLVAWFITTLLLSAAGFWAPPLRIPTIEFGVLVPIIVGVILFRQWPALRRIVEAVPQQWIVSVQAYRVEGLIFLLLLAAGRLPGVFAWPAGVGDVLVGLLAPAVGMAYARGWRGSAGLVRAWNLLGIADLVVAVGTGFLTSPSPFQMLAFDRPNALVTAFPLVMIPVFLVPLAVLLHLASLEKLRQTLSVAGGTGPQHPMAARDFRYPDSLPPAPARYALLPLPRAHRDAR
jgi:hypothetical protein